MPRGGTASRLTIGIVGLALVFKGLHAMDEGNTAYNEAMPKSDTPGVSYYAAEQAKCETGLRNEFDVQLCKDDADARYVAAERTAQRARVGAAAEDFVTWPVDRIIS
jgi:hypothetical protein